MKSNDFIIPDTGILLGKAIDYFENEMLLEAIAILEFLKNHHPDYGPAYCYLAWINTKYFKNHDQGEILFQKALQLNPVFPETYYLYAEHLNILGNYDEVARLYHMAKENVISNLERILFQLGISFEKQGQYKKAISIYEKAIPSIIDSSDLDEIMLAIDRCDIKMETTE